MLTALKKLREEENFWGYVHAKAIPGANPRLTEQLGFYADRMSVNIELPSQKAFPCWRRRKARKKFWPPWGRSGTAFGKIPPTW